MKLKDIKTGMKIFTRSKKLYIACQTDDGIEFYKPNGFISENAYNQDLTSKISSDKDIVLIYDRPESKTNTLNFRVFGDILYREFDNVK